MDFVGCACFVVAVYVVIFTSVRLFGHWISPFSVFYGVWFITFALYELGWINYVPVRQSTWMLISLNLVFFGIGWLIPYLQWAPSDLKSPNLLRQQVSPERLRMAIVICFALGTIGLTVFLQSISSTLGLRTYLDAPYKIREAMVAGGYIDEPLKPFNWLNVVNVVLCSFYLFVARSAKKRTFVWTVLTFSIFAVCLMEDRTRFFYATVWTAFVIIHAIRITSRKLVMGFAIGACVLLVQFVAVAQWLGKTVENNPALVAAAKTQQRALLQPYMYATSSFPALQAYIDSDPQFTYGLMTFYPLFRVMQMVNPALHRPQVVGEFFDVPCPANTFTWLYQFYSDFGIAGVIAGPWAIGLVSSYLYFRMLRTRSFYCTYLNGLVCFCLTLSVFVNHFTDGPAWYFIAFGALIAVSITNRQSSFSDIRRRNGFIFNREICSASHR